MKSFSKLAFVALVGAIGLSLASCGEDPAGNPPEASTPDGTEQVTITYSNFISNGGNEANLDAIVAAFEKDNPGINVEVKTLPYSDYFTVLQTDIAGGTVADVFDIGFANYRIYQANGVLAPLASVDTSVYQKSLADAYATDSTQYALPSSFSNVVLFYNKDLFDAAGVSYPTQNWTWADEKEAALKLTDTDKGIWGDYQPISYHEYYKSVAQAGGSFLNGDAVGFNSPAGIAAANWLVEKSGTVMPTAEQGSGTPDFDSQLFAQGKLAMWHTGIWNFAALKDTTFAWDIEVEPGDVQKASAMFSNALAVSAGSKNQEAATKWAQYMSSSDVMVDTRLTAAWELPPIADQSKFESYLTAGSPDNRQAVLDSLKAVALGPSIGENQAQMQDDVTNALTEIAAGRQKVEEAIPALAQKVSSLL